MLTPDVASDGVENVLEAIATRDLPLLLEFQKEEDSVGLDLLERETGRTSASCKTDIKSKMPTLGYPPIDNQSRLQLGTAYGVDAVVPRSAPR